MTVYFIGAGPGAADLMTLRGRAIIEASPVCVYAGALVPQEVLTWCSDSAKTIDSQHLSLDQIIDHMADAHAKGWDVARLHSGDPAIYSAVAEQARRLEALGIPFAIVPGVPAWAAAAAVIGRELTVPEVAQSVVLTRLSRRSSAMPPGETLSAFGDTGATLAIHLAVQLIDDVVDELLASRGPDCPVAVCARVSQPEEQILRGTLSTIAEQVKAAGISSAAVILVGEALAAKGFRDSHLYSCVRQSSQATT